MADPAKPTDTTSISGRFINGQQALALFWKLVPFIGGVLVGKGVIPQTYIDYIMGNQAEISGYVGTALALGAGAWSLWKNRPSKRVADVAKMPDVQVNVSDPQLATKVLQVSPSVDITTASAPK